MGDRSSYSSRLATGPPMAARLEPVARLEVLAISGGTAIVGRDHSVAVVHQVLHASVEAVHVLRGGPAVHVHDGRLAAVLLEIVGDVQKGGDLEIVPRRVVN